MLVANVEQRGSELTGGVLEMHGLEEIGPRGLVSEHGNVAVVRHHDIATPIAVDIAHRDKRPGFRKYRLIVGIKYRLIVGIPDLPRTGCCRDGARGIPHPLAAVGQHDDQERSLRLIKMKDGEVIHSVIVEVHDPDTASIHVLPEVLYPKQCVEGTPWSCKPSTCVELNFGRSAQGHVQHIAKPVTIEIDVN